MAMIINAYNTNLDFRETVRTVGIGGAIYALMRLSSNFLPRGSGLEALMNDWAVAGAGVGATLYANRSPSQFTRNVAYYAAAAVLGYGLMDGLSNLPGNAPVIRSIRNAASDNELVGSAVMTFGALYQKSSTECSYIELLALHNTNRP